MEAFVNCDELLAREPRMVVTERQDPSDGKRFEVSCVLILSPCIAYLSQIYISVVVSREKSFSFFYTNFVTIFQAVSGRKRKTTEITDCGSCTPVVWEGRGGG